MRRYVTAALFLCVLTQSYRTSGAEQKNEKTATEYEQMYDKLALLHVDESKAAVVSDLTLQRDVGVFHLRQGQLYACSPIAGRIVALLFIGDGTFSMKPPTQIEQEQLFRFYERDSVEMRFKTLFVLFADSTWEEVERKIVFGPGSARAANAEVQYCLKYLNDEDTKTFDTDFMYTFLQNTRNGLFYAHFSDDKLEPFFFRVDPFEEEEVSFSKRGGYSFRHDEEVISQFHTKAEYLSGTAGNEEEKDLLHVRHYKIDAHIEGDLKFGATVSMNLRSTSDKLRWIAFELDDDLDVDSASWSTSEPASFFRAKKSPVLWVQTPRPLARSELCTLTVHYKGDLLTKDELGWIGLRSSSSWYPRYGYRTRATFDLTFHSPAKWQLASVGKRQSAQRIGDTLVSQWITSRPAHNASFSIGPFKEITPEEKKEPPEQQPNGSLPKVTVLEFQYAPKGYGLSDLGTEVRDDILNSLRFFQHVYGKSPIEDLYVTETPYFHGEAFPGLIHLSWDTYKHVDTQGGNEIFRAHEVAHQWWGVGVNFRTYHDQWLSEAFSEYSGMWYMQTVLKDNEIFFDALDEMKESILGNRKYLLGSGQESGPIWLGYRTQSSNTSGDYDLIIYKKGAWVMHMLRIMMLDLKTMNEDRFMNMMREFYSMYLGTEASTSDFQHIVEKHMGANMDWFFHEWIMETKIPSYSFSYKTVKTPEGKFKTTCRVHQEGVSKEFTMPISLLLKFEQDKFYRLRINVSGEKEEYELPLLPLEPKEIVFNDLHSVLCNVNYESWK